MKNLKTFESFKQQSFMSNRQGLSQDQRYMLKDYNFELGEIVTLYHPSWRDNYEFKVIEPGKIPTLLQSDGEGSREIVLNRMNDFNVVLPHKLKKPKEPKIKPMTKVEFTRFVKELVSGHEDSDHSTFYDLAEGAIWDERLTQYIKKIIKRDDQIYNIKKSDIIEKLVNEMEMYAY